MLKPRHSDVTKLCVKHDYGVASSSRLLKIICLFCKRALWNRRYSAKETYNFQEPTNHICDVSHIHTARYASRTIWPNALFKKKAILFRFFIQSFILKCGAYMCCINVLHKGVILKCVSYPHRAVANDTANTVFEHRILYICIYIYIYVHMFEHEIGAK